MRFREPLLIPTVFFACGIVADRFLQFSLSQLLVAGVCLTCVLVAAWVWARRSVCLPVWTLIAVSGCAAAVWHRAPAPPQLDAESTEELLVTGCITEPPETNPGRQRIVVSLEPGARMRATWTPIRDEKLPALHYGQTVEFNAKVRKPHNFRNPGSFDFIGFLERQQIYWTGSVRGLSNLKVLNPGCGSGLLRRVYLAREWVLVRIAQLYPNDLYTSGLMAALLVGDTSQVQKTWTEDYRRTGTYHALVVSGLHVGVLAAALLFVFRLVGVPDLVRRLICLVLVWFYAVLAGWQAPVIRSAGGFTLFVIAGLVFRKARILNVLSAVALVFLLFDPEQLFEGSFQLSFLAVAAIGALAAPWLERWAQPASEGLRGLNSTRRDPRLVPWVAQMRVELRLLAETLHFWTPLSTQLWTASLSLAGRFLLWVYEGFVISLCVGVAMAVPMAVYFHRLSLTGISANLVVVPSLNVAIVAGFLAVGTGWHWLAAVAGSMLRLSGAVAQWHSRWELAPRVPDPALWLAALFSLALVATACAFRLSRRWLVPLGFSSVAVVLIAIAGHPFAPGVQPHTLELTAVDVGQGDSILMVLPDQTTVLIDGGGIPAFGGAKPALDIGEDVVSPYLWKRGFRTIDVIACTHAHDDHMGGLAALVRNFRPREVWAGASPVSPSWLNVEAEARTVGASVRRLHTGEGFDQGGANIDVLAPDSTYTPGPTARNDDSLVLLVRFGVHRFLLTGDAERATEQLLLSSQRLPRIDVLKVGHHGSKTSSSGEFLQALHPTFGIISAGLDNSYGHPHPDVLDRLSSEGVHVFRTDESGLVSFFSDGHRIRVETPATLATHRYPIAY